MDFNRTFHGAETDQKSSQFYRLAPAPSFTLLQAYFLSVRHLPPSKIIGVGYGYVE